MPSYRKTTCTKCGKVNGTNTLICTRCHLICSKCGETKSKTASQCKACYTKWQKLNPAILEVTRKPENRSKATNALVKYFKATGRSRELICQQCGDTFTGHTKKQKYCSHKCARIPAGLKRRRRKSCICRICDKAFEHTAYREGKYCSKECWSNRRKKRSCLNCGAVIESYTAKKFCSTKCTKAYHVGSNAPAWKDGKSLERERARLSSKVKAWRKTVYARDAYTCQHCGQQQGSLHAHHIKPWASHPELRFEVDNGLTLCESCHGKVHGIDFSKRKRLKVCPACGGTMKGRGKHCRPCSIKLWHESQGHKTTNINLIQLELALDP